MQLESQLSLLAKPKPTKGNNYSPPSYTWVSIHFYKLELYWVDEQDLLGIVSIFSGALVPDAISKRICITCKSPTSFGYFKKDEKATIGWRPSYFEK
jgi:hypothetical protein